MDMPDNVFEQLNPLTPRASTKVLYAPGRVCEKCLQTKAIEGHFANGSMICLVCQDLLAQQAGLPAERKALTRLLDAIDAGHSVPHATETLASLMRHMGGAEGIGKKTRRVFDRAFTDGDWKVCARILQTIIHTNVKVSEQQQDLAVESMDKEELRAYLGELYSKHVQITLNVPPRLPEPEENDG